MIHRIALLLGVLASAPLQAQTAPAALSDGPAPAAIPKAAVVPVAIDTSLGRIVVVVDRGHAPVTAANFLHYVDAHRFDGESFYRAMQVADGGLIQAGVRSDARKLFAPIAHEPTSRTGLHNVTGTLSMARLAPGTATADFFILLSDMPGFDADAPGGDADGFAAFGHVVEGMDVVKKIFVAPVSATKGEGVMKGQMLDPVVRIITAARVPAAPAR
ncbi:MAG: peptidylprolyl isomerase [Sphingomicrobium sp.]